MDAKFLIGLDFGGGGGRCLVIDVDTRTTSTAFRGWEFERPAELPQASDVDLERSWELLAECVHEAMSLAGATADQVAGIAATSMRHASVLLDASGKPLLATSNQDARGLGDTIELALQSGAALHRRTGHWPNPVQAAGRLRWFARERPELMERAAVHLSLGDWLGYRLSGELATDPTQAGETLLFALAERDWARELIDELGLPQRLFPAIRDPGSLLGGLGAEAAEALGLRAGTKVSIGGGDTQCGLLGVGATAPGDLAIVLGTTAPVQIVVEAPRLDDEGRLWAAPHAVPNRFVIESNGGGVGVAAEWVAGLLYPDAPYPLVRMFADAEASVPGASGMTSTLGAEVMDARRFGLPIGSLTLSPMGGGESLERRRHFARSLVEGFAFGLRANVEQAEAVLGRPAESIRIAGGMARNDFFVQTLANVLERPLRLGATPEATALGAAICAGVGAGLFPDLAAGAAALASPTRACAPEPAVAAAYSELYADWNILRLARSDADAAAATIAIKGLMSRPAARPIATASGERPKILVTADLDDAALESLHRLGDVEYAPFKQAMRLLTGRKLVEALAGVQIFVCEIDVVDAGALAEARDLRIVASCRGDAVNVDVGACSELGIPVLNAPGRNADAVADLTLTFLLMLARRLPEAAAFLREAGGEAGDMGRMGRAFKQLQGRELWHKTVGLVGLGAVGRKVVERLRPFGVHCIAHDPYVAPDRVRLAGAEPVDLDTLLERSDFISLHAAVSDETTGLIGAEQLARMRPGACLVNTARAALVDQDALVQALQRAHLGGAAMDVFAVEPPAADDPLLALPNVIATPHVGGNTAEVAAHQGRIIVDDLERLLAGERPLCALNPEILDAFDWSTPRTPPSAEVAARLAQRPAPAVTDLQKKAKSTETTDAAARNAAARVQATTNEGASETSGESVASGARVAELRSGMRRVLEAFASGLANDPTLAAGAAGRAVVLHFVVTDLDLDFHFGFRGDGLEGGLGAPAVPADVQLKMRADMLDGMFTGRSNPMQAAMEGEIAFSGDTAKAMTLTEIQADMERVYRATIESVGAPGDLASIPLPDTATGATGATGPPAGAEDSRMTAQSPAPAVRSKVPAGDIRHQLVEVVNELYTTQLITATGGNVSVRTGTPGEAWITPSQLFKGDLRPDILVRIGMDGRALDPGARSPSSEALMHTAVLEAKPEAQAVIHCHAPNATILVNSGLPFLPVSTEAAFLVGIGRIPFVMPGTGELAAAIVEAMGSGWAVLMQNHGLLVAGRTLRRAADMAEIVERTAEIILGCYAVGREPPVLPPELVESLAQMGDLMA